MNNVTIKIPYPPPIFKGSRVVKSQEYDEFVESIVAAFSERRDALDRADFYSLSIIAFPENRRKRSFDAIFKATFDALTAAQVWNDVSQVVDVKAIRGPAAEDPFLIVKISTFIYPTIPELIPENWGEETRWYDWTKTSGKERFFGDRERSILHDL